MRRNLLDLSVVIALTNDEHEHYATAQRWFDSTGYRDWGLCPFTEAGYIRVTTNPNVRPGQRDIPEAMRILKDLTAHPGYRFWPITASWIELSAPFSTRIFGHQQVTDAYLLGLAVKNDGLLVTLDRGIKFLAGAEFSKNLLVLG